MSRMDEEKKKTIEKKSDGTDGGRGHRLGPTRLQQVPFKSPNKKSMFSFFRFQVSASGTMEIFDNGGRLVINLNDRHGWVA